MSKLPYILIHMCAQNDKNGNPRRCYVIYNAHNGTIFDVYDEGYSGIGAVPDEIRARALRLQPVQVTTAQYRIFMKFRKTLKNR